MFSAILRYGGKNTWKSKQMIQSESGEKRGSKGAEKEEEDKIIVQVLSFLTSTHLLKAFDLYVMLCLFIRIVFSPLLFSQRAPSNVFFLSTLALQA